MMDVPTDPTADRPLGRANSTFEPFPPFPAEEVWAGCRETPLVSPPFDAFRYAEYTSLLQEWCGRHAGAVSLSRMGATMEGRTLWTLELGRGDKRILVWARQHGDEKICTPAVLNAVNFLLERPAHPVARAILDQARLLVVPFVNPDGAQRHIRRNSMGIDINRDASKGITPEGCALLEIKKTFDPVVAFNCHDMAPRKSTSSEKRLVALAVQAGPFDEWGGDNPVRKLAKRLCARMAEAAGARAHGHIARYDAPYMPRAFGDAMMRWGVACCLIESGGWWEPGAEDFVGHLHALALLAGIHAAATGAEQTANAAYYDALPLDTGRPFFDLLVREPWIFDGSGRPRFRAEVGVDYDPYARRYQYEHCRALGRIKDLGDMSEDQGKTELAANDILMTPGLVAIAPGLRLDTPDALAPLERFLAAGFTTVIGGCGPFETERRFDEWREGMNGAPLPVNYMAFEVVESIGEILARHGQTGAFGLLVPDLLMRPADLLSALHVFHPAAHSALTEEQEAMALAVDLLLHAEGHPQTNRVHLLVRPLDDEGRASRGNAADSFVDSATIQGLFAAFIRHPRQIVVTVDTTCPVLGFFPTPPIIAGLGGGRLPSPDFLARMFQTLKCATEEGIGMILSRLTRQPAMGLGLRDIGLVRQDYRADLALFPLDPPPEGDAPIDPATIRPPRDVVVNGLPSFANGSPTERRGGLLLLR